MKRFVARRLCWRSVCALAIGLLAYGDAPLTAGVPEPDALIHGEIFVGGAPLAPGGQVTARRDGAVLASYHIGEDPRAGDLYVLRLQIESGAVLGAFASRVGDRVDLFVEDRRVASAIQIVERGMVSRRDLDLAPPEQDFDSDGVGDLADNCAREANPGQIDSDDDGIGDVCEARLDPAPELRFVGSVGNSPDPESAAGLGRVDHSYELTRGEVSNAQYVRFLNSVAVIADPNGLYNPLMSSDPRGGIERSGESGAYRYRVRGPEMGNKPVNFVSWLDAARYANWLENGRPVAAQGAGSTEDGAFDLTGVTPELDAVALEDVEWSLPLEDEWYKAAYYDAAIDHYWIFATGSDAAPAPAEADALGGVSNPGANVAVYDSAADWNGQDGHVASVNGTTSVSPHGIADLSGNVGEWSGSPAEEASRIVRGGGYDSDADGISKIGRALMDPALELPNVGFRVARVGAVPDDEDGDGIRGDEDGDGEVGSHPCSAGQVAGCDDNCIEAYNPEQSDVDVDGVGDPCECNWNSATGRFQLAGDANADGRVDGADYTLWADHYRTATPGFAKGDFNCDGSVDGADYTIWADHYGEEAP